MADIEQDVSLACLQKGSEYCTRFREAVKWSLFFSFAALVLLVVLLLHVLQPQLRTFYVSSTQGSVVRVVALNPKTLKLASVQQREVNEANSLRGVSGAT